MEIYIIVAITLIVTVGVCFFGYYEIKNTNDLVKHELEYFAHMQKVNAQWDFIKQEIEEKAFEDKVLKVIEKHYKREDL